MDARLAPSASRLASRLTPRTACLAPHLRALAVWQVLAACEKGLGFGIPHSHLNHLNSMEEVVSYFNWRVEEVAQHGQSPVWALPQLGSCASPGQAWRGLGSSVLP